MNGPKVHPAADLFPIMDQAGLKELADDIRQNGLLEAIVLCDGQVLDGRNRATACEMAGITPRFEEPTIASPISYVLSKNLHRRHLTTGQRAIVAAEAVPLLQEEAKKRQGGVGRYGSCQKQQEPHNKEVTGTARALAAKQLGVGGTTVQFAIDIKRADPKLFERVKQGTIAVYTAKRALSNPDLRKKLMNGPRQRHSGIRKNKVAPYELDTDRKRQRAKVQEKVMIQGLTEVDLFCTWLLGKFDLGMVRSVCSRKELGDRAQQAEKASTVLRTFANNLKRR